MLESITNNKFIYLVLFQRTGHFVRPCCYLFESEFDILKVHKVSLNDVRGILEEHLETVQNTKKLTYSQRMEELGLYTELLRQPDQEITETAYKRYREKKTRYQRAIFYNLIYTLLSLCFISFYPLITGLMAVGNIIIIIYINHRVNKYKRKMDVAVAAHVMVIHALKKDFKSVGFTVYDILNYKQ